MESLNGIVKFYYPTENGLLEHLDLEKVFKDVPKLYETENQSNPTAFVKFKSMIGKGEWFITEAQVEGDDVMMFGYVKLFENEWGYISLTELLNTGMITLDQAFKPTKINKVKA